MDRLYALMVAHIKELVFMLKKLPVLNAKNYISNYIEEIQMQEPKPLGVFALQVGSYETLQEADESGAKYELAQGCFHFEGTTGGHNLDMIVAVQDFHSAIGIGNDWEVVVEFDNGEVQDAYTYFNEGYLPEIEQLRDALRNLLEQTQPVLQTDFINKIRKLIG